MCDFELEREKNVYTYIPFRCFQQYYQFSKKDEIQFDFS